MPVSSEWSVVPLEMAGGSWSNLSSWDMRVGIPDTLFSELFATEFVSSVFSFSAIAALELRWEVHLQGQQEAAAVPWSCVTADLQGLSPLRSLVPTFE